MQEELITVNFRMWEGDITPAFLHPVAKVGLFEVLRVTFADGQWEVTSTAPDASPNWIGRSESRQGAILNYLKARLGLYETE